jgi:transcriptional regulator with XRE-family HTH domain
MQKTEGAPMKQPDETPLDDAKTTGRRYTSIKEMMRGEGVPDAIQKQAAELANERRVAIYLAKMRTRAGLTQSDMAKRLGLTQSAISKLEAGTDAEITLKELKQYTLVCKERFSILFGKPLNHAEAIKHNALQMRTHLEELAALANEDETLEKEIGSFFGEAFFNLLTILAYCSEKIPNDTGVKIEPVRYDGSSRAQSKDARGLTAV